MKEREQTPGTEWREETERRMEKPRIRINKSRDRAQEARTETREARNRAQEARTGTRMKARRESQEEIERKPEGKEQKPEGRERGSGRQRTRVNKAGDKGPGSEETVRKEKRENSRGSERGATEEIVAWMESVGTREERRERG